MTGTEFRLIGPLQVLVDTRPVRLPGAAERSLLAVLLLSAGRTVSVPSLIDSLWSEAALPVDPLNALQLRVSKLRRALAVHGTDVIVREASGYRADVDPDRVDVHHFAKAVAAARAVVRDSGPASAPTALAMYDNALSLWRGDPLADFADSSWATVEAARLQQLHVAALAERAELALVAGRHAEVAADLEPVVARDPGQEPMAGLLMTALYRGGRQGDALDVYGRTRRWLADELGLQPSAALRSLHQRILQQDRGLSASPAPVTRGTPPPGGEDTRAPGALPVPTTELIGREATVRTVHELLERHRVVTLVGPGGAGKTTLALVVAKRVAEKLEGQVHLVRLAVVGNPRDVDLAVAEAVGVPLDGADPTAGIRDRLVAYLANRRLLLVLDNCEHVVDAAARLTDHVLAVAPDVTVLATSREALAVPGEAQVAVGPLEVPPPGTPAERVLGYPAARLFAQRARAVRSDLKLGEADLAALPAVCAQLDGLPLALELAAARTSSLSVVELGERLSDRFHLLTTGPRTAETRHRTLRGTVEWSHALLTDVEQQVFRRLAVFQGGWTLPAAEAVAAGGDVREDDVLDVLGRLVERSMVIADPGHPTRYRMLETLRQYGLERLERSGERHDVLLRHARYFRRLADAAEPALRGRGQRTTMNQLRQEHPNLRAALDVLSVDPEAVDEALHLAGALGLFWHLGRHVEGRSVLRRLMASQNGSAPARARALQAVSLVERPRACLVHPSARCGETAAQSLDLFLEVGDQHRAALSRVLLAVEYLDGSDPDRFETLLTTAEEQFIADADDWGHAVIAFVRLQGFLRAGDEARARAVGRAAADAFRRLDDGWGLSAVLYHLGWGLREFGSYAEAVPVLEDAIDVATGAGMHNTAQWALGDLGVALLYLGDSRAAAECFDRAEAASDEIGDAAGQVLAALGRGVMARIRDDVSSARSWFQAAVEGLRRLGTPLWAGQALAGLGWCDWRTGLLEDALERYEDVWRIGEAAAEPTLMATGLEGLARVAAARGHSADASRRLASAAQVRHRGARPAPPHEQAELSALQIEPVDAASGASTAQTPSMTSTR